MSQQADMKASRCGGPASQLPPQQIGDIAQTARDTESMMAKKPTT